MSTLCVGNQTIILECGHVLVVIPLVRLRNPPVLVALLQQLRGNMHLLDKVRYTCDINSHEPWLSLYE